MNRYIRFLIWVVDIVNSVVFCLINLYYIAVYLLFMDAGVGFEEYSNEEFTFIIVLNIWLVISSGVRLFIHSVLKKQNRVFFTIACIIFLAALFIPVFFTIFYISEGEFKNVILIQQCVLYFTPFIHLLLLVIYERYCLKNAKKAKNRLKYW